MTLTAVPPPRKPLAEILFEQNVALYNHAWILVQALDHLAPFANPPAGWGHLQRVKELLRDVLGRPRIPPQTGTCPQGESCLILAMVGQPHERAPHVGCAHCPLEGDVC